MAEGTPTQQQQGRRRIIERPRLTRLLDESPARIKMLVAPAGYGKTTLARQWLADSDRLYAWSAISRPVTDVAVATTALATAAAALGDELETPILDRMKLMNVPEDEIDTLASLILKELARWPSETLIVIDDFHNFVSDSHAEALLSSVVHQSKTEFLLCSRRRPTWVTARELLYGNMLEIGRHELSMTDEEAAAVLDRSDARTSGLVAVAGGWPAVVGLTALRSDVVSKKGLASALPDTLHHFLADELYQALDYEGRDVLCKFALVGSASREMAITLLHPNSDERALDSALDAGWISVNPQSRLELHPLLRTFLLERISNGTLSVTKGLVHDVTGFLIGHREWDAAFALIEQHDQYDILPTLLRASLRESLDAGRTASVASWIELADLHSIAGPEVALARAELAFRNGNFAESEIFARTAIKTLDDHDHWTSWASASAGRSAYAATRTHEALAHYRRARQLALTSDDHERAAAGELAAAIDLELPEAPSLLDALAPNADNIEELVFHMGRWINLHYSFGTLRSLEKPRSVSRLVHRARDPISRCSFRNAYSYVLASAGLVDEGRDVLAEQLADARAHSLDFVTPYAIYNEGMLDAFAGLFGDAAQKSAEVQARGRTAGDDLLVLYSRMLDVRCLLAKGALDEAVSLTAAPIGSVPKSLKAEIKSLRALALACSGRTERALTIAEQAEETSSATDVRVGVAVVRAVVCLSRETPNAYSSARSALHLAQEHFSVQTFVCACRTFPQLPATLLQSPETRELIHDLLTVSQDTPLLASLDEGTPPVSGSWEALSPREREVLLLVSDGLTNIEIGKRLFVAEATVKVHVRHAFEKLDVKSRTAAALRVPRHARATQHQAHETKQPERPKT